MEEERNGLALCMLYSQNTNARGQRFRDAKRLSSLEQLYDCRMHSCDLHQEQEGIEGRHLMANLDTTRFQRSFKWRWPGKRFDFCVLDYFGMPSSYADHIFRTGCLFRENIPFLADQCGVSEFWIPNTR